MDNPQELAEDVEDLAAVLARRDEPTISHEEVIAELQRDGIITTTTIDHQS
jgi:hypothetical protein